MQAGKSSLSPEQAQKLLSPIGTVTVDEITVSATINNVFRVKTREHGVFYIKFHTDQWYADQPDTFFVVNRECATHELLRRRGISLPYRAWGDYTKSVVSRSVFIAEELSGTPVTEVLIQFPQEANEILRAFGRYMQRLHAIEFSLPGLLEPAHAYFAGEEGRIPPVIAWPVGVDHPSKCQREALEAVDKAENAGVLSRDIASEFRQLLQDMAETIKPGYEPPRFVVGNCHAYHFHMQQSKGAWKVLGFYDFEEVQAGDPTIDLVELEMTLTPSLRSYAWRKPFFEGYGRWPDFRAYKMRLLSEYVLYYRSQPQCREVPDPAWLDQRWSTLIKAQDWDALLWFPTT